MDPDSPAGHQRASDPARSNSGSAWLRLMLEDDQPFWQMLIAFGRRRHSDISQRLRFGLAVGVFLFVIGLVSQAVDSGEVAIGDRGVTGASTSTPIFLEKTEAAVPPAHLSHQQDDWRPRVGSGANDENFTLGSIDLESDVKATAPSQSVRAGTFAQNTGAVRGLGGGSTGGFGGGAAEPGNTVAAAAEKAAAVPEISPTVLLLGMALIALLGLHRLLAQRRTAAASRYR